MLGQTSRVSSSHTHTHTHTHTKKNDFMNIFRGLTERLYSTINTLTM